MDKKIIVSLGVDTSGVTKGMGKAQQEVNQGTNGMASGFKKVTSGIGSFVGGIGKIAAAVGVFTLVQTGVNAIQNGVRALTSEMNDNKKAWSSFEGNMKILGKTDQEIQKVKGSLQDYAVQTVYNASEIASTYAQLEAVGTESTESLVKGMAGLAASAENPKQAMESLSLQMTQAAGRPTIAWEDFRVMLQQAPAGMAAVAEHMGMSMDELVASIQAGEVSTDDFLAAVTEVGNRDEFQKMATEFRTVDEAIEGLTESLAIELAPTFDLLSGVAISAIGAITEAFESFDWESFNNGLESAIEWVTNLFSTIRESTAFQTFGEAVGILNEKFTELRETFQDSEAFQTIKDIFEELGDILLNIDFTKLADGISLIVDVLGPPLMFILDSIVAQFKILWEAIKLVGSIFGEVFDHILEWFEENGEPIKEAINTLFDNEGVNSSLEEMSASIREAWDGIKEIVFTAIDLILEIIKLTLALLTGDWETAWESIKTILSLVWEIIKSVVKSAISAVWNNIKEKLNSIKSTWDNRWQAIGNFLGPIWEGIKSFVSNGIDNIRNKVDSGLSAIQNFFTSKWNAIKSTTSNALSSMVSTVRSKISQFTQAGRDLITGLWNGIKNMFSSVTGWVGDLAQGLVNKVKGIFGVKSPSRVFHQIGEFLMQGFMGGMDSLSGKAMKQMESFSKGIIDEADGIAPKVNSSLNALDPDVSFKGNTSLSAQLDKLKDKDNTPIVHVHVSDGDIYLDDEKVGKKLAPTVKKENDKVKGMRDRSKGINSNFGGVFG